MKTVKKILHYIVEAEAMIAMLLLVIVIVLNAYEIFQRNVLSKSFIWLQEYSTLILLWFAMLGTCKIVYEKQDICVDMFVKKFPEKVHTFIRMLTHLLIACFMVVAVRQTWILLLSQVGRYTLVAKYPLQLRSYALLIAFVTIGLINLYYFVETIVEMKTEKKGSAE